MSDYNTNDFEQFITARIDLTTATPPVGNTGDGEQFVTARIDLAEFTKVDLAVGPFLTTGAGYSIPVGD